MIGVLAGVEGIGRSSSTISASRSASERSRGAILFDGRRTRRCRRCARRKAGCRARLRGVVGTGAVRVGRATRRHASAPEALPLARSVYVDRRRRDFFRPSRGVASTSSGGRDDARGRVGPQRSARRDTDDATDAQPRGPSAALDWPVAAEIVVQIGVGLAVGASRGARWCRALQRWRLPHWRPLSGSDAGARSYLRRSTILTAADSCRLRRGSHPRQPTPGPPPPVRRATPVHDAVAWLVRSRCSFSWGSSSRRRGSCRFAATRLGLALFILSSPAHRRPICLAPFAYTRRDVLFVGWPSSRRRPIVLATYPVLVAAPGAERIFNLVFFIVVVSARLQGGTIPGSALLRARVDRGPRPAAVSRSNLPSRFEASYCRSISTPRWYGGRNDRPPPFTAGSAATLIVRGQELSRRRATLSSHAGDHVYVLTSSDERAFIELMFRSTGRVNAAILAKCHRPFESLPDSSRTGSRQ